jgi:hypothetical protein
MSRITGSVTGLETAPATVAVRVSMVALPICGKMNIFFRATYAWLSVGSPSNTSSPAAATRPLFRATMRSSSTTNPARAVFTTIAPKGRRPMALEFKRWWV